MAGFGALEAVETGTWAGAGRGRATRGSGGGARRSCATAR
ncbi:MAG: hypothetical protein JWQ36_3440, partial [Enterovirga sp.]|nr:hypothetical protein [Enterovirga sp.]